MCLLSIFFFLIPLSHSISLFCIHLFECEKSKRKKKNQQLNDQGNQKPHKHLNNGLILKHISYYIYQTIIIHPYIIHTYYNIYKNKDTTTKNFCYPYRLLYTQCIIIYYNILCKTGCLHFFFFYHFTISYIAVYRFLIHPLNIRINKRENNIYYICLRFNHFSFQTLMIENNFFSFLPLLVESRWYIGVYTSIVRRYYIDNKIHTHILIHLT